MLKAMWGVSAMLPSFRASCVLSTHPSGVRVLCAGYVCALVLCVGMVGCAACSAAALLSVPNCLFYVCFVYLPSRYARDDAGVELAHR